MNRGKSMTFRLELASASSRSSAEFVFAGEGLMPSLELTADQWTELGRPVLLNLEIEALWPSRQELDRAAGRQAMPDRHDVWTEGFEAGAQHVAAEGRGPIDPPANPYEAGELE